MKLAPIPASQPGALYRYWACCILHHIKCSQNVCSVAESYGWFGCGTICHSLWTLVSDGIIRERDFFLLHMHSVISCLPAKNFCFVAYSSLRSWIFLDICGLKIIFNLNVQKSPASQRVIGCKTKVVCRGMQITECSHDIFFFSRFPTDTTTYQRLQAMCGKWSHA